MHRSHFEFCEASPLSSTLGTPSAMAVLHALGAALFSVEPGRAGGRMLEISRSFSVITKYEENDVVGQSLSFLYGSRTDPATVRAVNRALAQRKVFQGELLFYRGDGTAFWCELVLAPEPKRESAPEQMVGALMDITDRMRQDQKIRELEARRRGIFENAVEGIYQSTPEGQYLEVNLALAKMYGYKRPEDLLHQVSDIQSQIYVDPAMRERFKAEIDRSDQVRGLEYQVRRRDGRIIWISESARVVRDANGRARYYEGFIEDITQRKEAETALRVSQQKLIETSRQVGMAEVATGILHNLGNALNSISVSATSASELVGQSKAGNVAKLASLIAEHAADLGTFLSQDKKGKQIPEFLTQLGARLADEQSKLLLELGRLRKSVDHASGILAVQQNYAKAASPIETVSVQELAEDALQMNAGALARHKVEAVRDYARGLPPVTIPKHKVLQIVMNLVRNALHACTEAESTGKRITVATRESHGGKWVQIEVRDTGVGMSEATLSRLFEHGFTTRKDGHGFGLHSAAAIAKELGGCLTGQSDGLGTGSTFVLAFPCQPPPASSR